MAVRASKAALAEAAVLLGKDRKVARQYLMTVQRRAGRAIPFTVIVGAMKDLGSTEIQPVMTRARERCDGGTGA